MCLYSTVLGSSSGPVHSIVRCLDDDSCGFRSEKKKACLVLLRLNLPADKPFPWIDLYLEELAVWNMCSFQFQRYLFQRDQVWIDFKPRDNGSVLHAYRYSFCFWSSPHSIFGFVGGTTERVNPIFFVPIWSLLSIFHECQNRCPSYCSVSFMKTSVS